MLILGIATVFTCQSRGQRSATTQSQPHRRFFSRIMFTHLSRGTLWKKKTKKQHRTFIKSLFFLSFLHDVSRICSCLVMIRAFEALRSRITVSSFAASKSHGSDTRRLLILIGPPAWLWGTSGDSAGVWLENTPIFQLTLAYELSEHNTDH